MAGSKLTVAQLLPALEGGGVERGTLEVADELVRRGHRSLVISAGGTLESRLTGRGSEHITWPIGRKSLLTLRWARPLRELVRQEGVDILHARSRMPAWVAYRAWKGLPEAQQPRFVTTVHGLYRPGTYSGVMARGERVIAVSDTARDYVQQHYKVPPERLRTIYRGVDREIFPHGYRPPESWFQRWFDQYPFLLDRLVLTLPGRIRRRKGHEDFLQLLHRLLEQGVPVHGLIVGDTRSARPGYLKQLDQRIARLGLQDRVSFTGHRLDMRDIYVASNLVVSLSRAPESFGRTVLEALSLGVPVLGYDHGGVGELLGKLFPAGRVPVGDLEAAAEQVWAFQERPPEVPPVRGFALQDTLDQTLAVYEELTA